MKYKSKLTHLKTYILEEFLPLSFYLLNTIFIFSSAIALLIFFFSCFMWPTTIYYWVAYFLWTRYDSRTLMTDGRKLHCLKYLLAFECVRNYSPLRLIKTVDLPSTGNYIFATFPHGVIPLGTIFNLIFNVNSVADLFPNLDIRVATLKFMFLIPITREYLMSLGYCTTDAQNIKYLLNGKPSKAIMIFPGGMKELHLSHAGNECTIIKHRKGFIRIALETGSSLVPVFSFNEHNTLDQGDFESPIINYILKILYICTRARINNIKGRGFFQKKFGILPHRVPVTTVVGEPIQVPKIEKPSSKLVDEYHEKFYQALHDLFERYKVMYDKAGNNAKLIMIE